MERSCQNLEHQVRDDPRPNAPQSTSQYHTHQDPLQGGMEGMIESQRLLQGPNPAIKQTRPTHQMKTLNIVVYDSSPSASSEVHYPRVRYIFDDDDPGLLSNALSAQHRLVTGNSSSGGDRAVLLGISSANGGYDVSWATSLSPDWVVTTTRLKRMESGPSGADSELREDEPWMLTLEGVDLLPEMDMASRILQTAPNAKSTRPHNESGILPVGNEEGEMLGDDYEYKSLIRSFNMRMDLLKHLVEHSEHRQRCLSSDDMRQDDGQ